MTLPLTLSEADFQRTVLDYAMLRGWRCSHARPARTTHGWVTPITGHAGAPDLLLARDGVAICAELKRHGARPTPDQRLWLAALGGVGRLWRPTDWPSVVEELR